MQLQHIVLAPLLWQQCYSRAMPRQLIQDSPQMNQLAARQPQDQTASDSSTINTSTIPASPTSNDTSATTSTTTATSATRTGPRNHNVAVGQNGTTFTPSTLKNIPPGDTLTFYFYPSNYSVVQSSFEKPCQPIQNGIYSGFQPTFTQSDISRQKFVVNVTSVETMWIYAIDGALLANDVQNVCEKGMAMVLNPLPKQDASGRTLGNYKKAAATPDKNGAEEVQCPSVVSGGTIKGVSDKEKARWESKHPIGGGNGTAENGTSGRGNGTDVLSYESAAAEGPIGRGNSFMAFGVLLMTSVFGLGL